MQLGAILGKIPSTSQYLCPQSPRTQAARESRGVYAHLRCRGRWVPGLAAPSYQKFPSVPMRIYGLRRARNVWQRSLTMRKR